MRSVLLGASAEREDDDRVGGEDRLGLEPGHRLEAPAVSAMGGGLGGIGAWRHDVSRVR